MVLAEKKSSVSPVPFVSLVDWALFFGTVLFLVNKNMVLLLLAAFYFYTIELITLKLTKFGAQKSYP